MMQRPIDKGDPGKFYFHKPIAVTISSLKPEPYTDPRKEPVNLVNYNERTNCRLLSSRNAMNHKPPKQVNYLLSTHPTFNEIQDYLELKRVEGFGEGAIVCRRWAPDKAYRWSQQWGTIMICHKAARGTVATWAPYAVKWHMVGEIEQAWAEDLVVIHACLDEDQLDAIVEAQGVIE